MSEERETIGGYIKRVNPDQQARDKINELSAKIDDITLMLSFLLETVGATQTLPAYVREWRAKGQIHG